MLHASTVVNMDGVILSGTKMSAGAGAPSCRQTRLQAWHQQHSGLRAQTNLDELDGRFFGSEVAIKRSIPFQVKGD